MMASAATTLGPTAASPDGAAPAFWNHPLATALADVGSGDAGLDTPEAEQRLSGFGPSPMDRVDPEMIERPVH